VVGKSARGREKWRYMHTKERKMEVKVQGRRGRWRLRYKEGERKREIHGMRGTCWFKPIEEEQKNETRQENQRKTRSNRQFRGPRARPRASE
jgi:hypothetical protein